MTWILSTRIGRWISIAGGVLLAFAGAWFAGWRDGKNDAKADNMEDQLDAHDRITSADTGVGLLTLTALGGCTTWGTATGSALDRLRPDAEAHARALAGDSLPDARETGLTLLARLGALAGW